MHGLGVTRAVAGAVPEALVPALLALTQLGDPWFLTALVTVGYWLGSGRVLDDHRDGARLVAVALVAFAAVAALKALVGHPRPPASVALVAADGFALPSGHATGSAAVYVGAALLWTRPSRRTRLALAAGLVALVSATRVALGVHYLLDVVVGALLGAGVAVGVLALTRESVERGFWAAAAVGAAGFVAAPAATDALAVAGTGLGAALAWRAVENGGVSLGRPSRALVAVGVVAVGGFAVAALALPVPVAAVAVSGAGLGACVVAPPAVQNVSR